MVVESACTSHRRLSNCLSSVALQVVMASMGHPKRITREEYHNDQCLIRSLMSKVVHKGMVSATKKCCWRVVPLCSTLKDESSEIDLL